jgi:drug/metabolite transporter (DMT)-like permease
MGAIVGSNCALRAGADKHMLDSVDTSPLISERLHLKTRLLILLIAIFGPVGNVLLSKGMKSIGPATSWEPAQLFTIGEHVFGSGLIWLGIASLLMFFVAYMVVLTWADYSYVQPASAVAYLVVALLARFALGEEVTALRWTGIAIICVGVLIVGRTTPRGAEGS